MNILWPILDSLHKCKNTLAFNIFANVYINKYKNTISIPAWPRISSASHLKTSLPRGCLLPIIVEISQGPAPQGPSGSIRIHRPSIGYVEHGHGKFVDLPISCFYVYQAGYPLVWSCWWEHITWPFSMAMPCIHYQRVHKNCLDTTVIIRQPAQFRHFGIVTPNPNHHFSSCFI